MEKLGIIGGLGPMATAYFMQLIIEMTDAASDQEHIEMIIYNCPAIPDRTKFILGLSKESPVGPMVEIGKKLTREGIHQIAVPCITAHYFHDELEHKIGVPVVHGIAETADYLAKRGYKKVGIMATDGTVKTELFSRELEKKGMKCVYPSSQKQAYVMELIYGNVKAGKPVDLDKFSNVSEELRQKGAELILLGCTELSMIKRDYVLAGGYLDVMEVLAKCCVERCGKLKPKYQELITNPQKDEKIHTEGGMQSNAESCFRLLG